MGDDQPLNDLIEAQFWRRFGQDQPRLSGTTETEMDLAAQTIDRLGQMHGRFFKTPLAGHGNGHSTGLWINVPGRFQSI
jgi:hypothetical protein